MNVFAYPSEAIRDAEVPLLDAGIPVTWPDRERMGAMIRHVVDRLTVGDSGEPLRTLAP